jgi:hypothetical protein
MIATLMLGTTVLAVMSYNILNLKEEPKQEVKQEEPKQESPPAPKVRTPWVFPRREEPSTVRIITPNKEGGSTVKKCWNFECELLQPMPAVYPLADRGDH